MRSLYNRFKRSNNTQQRSPAQSPRSSRPDLLTRTGNSRSDYERTIADGQRLNEQIRQMINEANKYENFDNVNEICSICLEPMSTGKISINKKCKHLFHTACIKTWHGKCPLCRSGFGHKRSKKLTKKLRTKRTKRTNIR